MDVDTFVLPPPCMDLYLPHIYIPSFLSIYRRKGAALVQSNCRLPSSTSRVSYLQHAGPAIAVGSSRGRGGGRQPVRRSSTSQWACWGHAWQLSSIENEMAIPKGLERQSRKAQFMSRKERFGALCRWLPSSLPPSLPPTISCVHACWQLHARLASCR